MARNRGTNTAARVMNDLGLGAWFGSALFEAVGVDGRGDGLTARSTHRKWTPLGLAAMTASAVGGSRLAQANMPRIRSQAGVAEAAATKTALMTAGSATTLASHLLGLASSDTGAMKPSRRRMFRVLDVASALFVGGALVADARLGEQQRPTAVARGVAKRTWNRLRS